MTATTPAPITIALAQLPVIKAAVDDNLKTHLAYIERAAALGANVVAFPELSLTGYELALLSQLAMPRDDATFAALTAAAVGYQHRSDRRLPTAQPQRQTLHRSGDLLPQR
ncbi:nitrilase-related carbon-nitrogen hydrolase [Vreelandella aquamarina]|jgi:predicted amidohydrolase|uniref:nitrilase-related carbon-nitrogen hydrolase n=1 Tax=Vreelandella aquamarina TaxID=77097 RepID=UPI001FCA49B9|nr:nitrilase-related carbon-nitrogen hydrolase [Halomonas aquamarina]